MTIYIDVCFVINFVMDIVIFFITSVISKSVFYKKKVLLACLIESATYCFLIISGFIKYSFLFTIVINLAALYIVFKPRSLMRFLELSLIMIITAFTLGGIVIWLLYFSNIPQALALYFGRGYGKYTIFAIVICVISVYIFIKFSGRWIDTAYSQRDRYCRVKIFNKGFCVELTALIDSGSFLRGKGNRALVVAESGALIPLFKNDINDMVLNSNLNDKFYSLNYSSLGKENGSVKVFKADKAEFIFSNKEGIFYDADIAFYNGILSCQGGYKAIISSDDYFKIRRTKL